MLLLVIINMLANFVLSWSDNSILSFFFLFMATLKELFAEWKLILWKNHRDAVEGIIQHCYLAGNFCSQQRALSLVTSRSHDI